MTITPCVGVVFVVRTKLILAGFQEISPTAAVSVFHVAASPKKLSLPFAAATLEERQWIHMKSKRRLMLPLLLKMLILNKPLISMELLTVEPVFLILLIVPLFFLLKKNAECKGDNL